nr:MAG TPA: CotJB protein [Caudoviricetes sp.]
MADTKEYPRYKVHSWITDPWVWDGDKEETERN